MTTGTLTNVELVRVGDWNASTGKGHITTADLDAMATAHADHVVDRPAVKVGHQTDNVFNADTNDGAGDGEPAYGWIENVTRGDGSSTRPHQDALYGNLVGMPTKLAEVAPTAWRRRSVEIAWGVKTAAGRTYKAVLSGVALLGVARPAVKGMADVLALYAAGTTADTVSVVELVDGMTASQVSAFAEVLEQLAAVHDTITVPPAPTTAPESAGGKPPTEEKHMVTAKDVEDALKAEGDASVEDRLRALLDPTDGNNDPDPTKDDAGAADDGEKDDDEKPADAAEPKPNEQTVTLTASQFAALTAGSQAGAEAAARFAAQDRDTALTTALTEGRIPPAAVDAWRAAWDSNPASTKTLLTQLPAGAVPITELGDDTHGDTSRLSDAEDAAETAAVRRMFGLDSNRNA